MFRPLHADAEMVVNSENKPLPVKNFAAPHLLCPEGTKPLPSGARRWVWARLWLPAGQELAREEGGGGLCPCGRVELWSLCLPVTVASDVC